MKPQEQIKQQGESALQRVLWGGLILVLIGVMGAGVWSLIRGQTAARRVLADRSPRLPVYSSVPEFSLIERSGRKVKRTEFLGKIWVVNFFYSHCPDTCPLQSAEMARLQADLATESDVRLVSITVDPQRDTLQVLSRYADRFGADHDRWLFLTGEKEAIYRFAQDGLRLPVIDPRNKVRGLTGKKMLSKSFNPERSHLFGQLVSDLRAGAMLLPGAIRSTLEPSPAMAGDEGVGGVKVLHTSRFVLVDRRARIRGYYESTDMESLRRLRQDVKALLQEE